MIDERLRGRWRSSAGSAQPEVSAVFSPDGSLVYTVHGADSDEVMLLRFVTRDGLIVTDQPSAPREEVTQYRFEEPDLLVLTYDDEETYFRRE